MIILKKDVEELIKISDERANNGDMIGAVSVLLNDCTYKKKDCEIYKKLGDLYMSTNNYRYSAYYFFRYLDVCRKKEIKDTALKSIISCIRKGSENLAHFVLSEYWNYINDGDSDYQDEISDFLNEFEENKKPELRLVKTDENKKNHDMGVRAFNENNFKKAIKYFSLVEKNSKFYANSLFKTGTCYHFLNKGKQALEIFCDYFKNYTPTAMQYCYFLQFLDEYSEKNKKCNELKDFYLKKLLNLKIKKSFDNYCIAHLLFTVFHDYKTALMYLTDYLVSNPYEDDAISMKGACLYLVGDREGGIVETKKAYLFTHLFKYKYILNCMKSGFNDKKYNLNELSLYPYNLKKDFLNILTERRYKKNISNELSEKDWFELIDYACDLDDMTFWQKLIAVMYREKKELFWNIAVVILLNEEIDASVKSLLIEKLALKGYNKVQSVIFMDSYTLIKFQPLNCFKSELFKQAVCYLVGKLLIDIDDEFITAGLELEKKFLQKNIECSKIELSGVILINSPKTNKKFLSEMFYILQADMHACYNLSDKILQT